MPNANISLRKKKEKKRTYERFLCAPLICDRELTQKGAKDIYNDINTNVRTLTSLLLFGIYEVN